jgi:macrolide transport system ATP-binding/permease protein
MTATSRPLPDALPHALIELRGLTKTYHAAGLAVEVLHGISLDIHAGEYVAIMGQSGSGKTTLMNLLGCLDVATTGSYRLGGEDVSGLSRDRLALLRRDTFGFIFQRYNLLANATATENVEIPAIYAGLPSAARRTRARAILSSLGLAERLDHRPTQLSGGQQQRVSVARALMNGGRVILADEPTGALDSHSGAEVMALLRALNDQGHTVILITHDLELAQHAARLIEIRDGRVVADTRRADSTNSALPPGPQVSQRMQRMQPTQPTQPTLAPRTAAAAAGLLPDLVEAVKMAFRSLHANLFRTLLTLLGIIIGVASVVAMLALGDGSKQAVLSRIEAMGTNLLLVRPGARGVRVSGEPVTLLPDDALAIAELPNVAQAVPEYTGGATLRAGNADYIATVNSTSEALPLARDWPLARGAFFSAADVASYAPVAVLGQTVAANLYPAGFDPVGSYVLVANIPFQVIGVMAPKGATTSGTDMDDVVFIPITTGRMRLFGKRYVRTITVQVNDVQRIDTTQQAIATLLTARHRKPDFQIRNMADILETAADTQNTLTVLLGSIAAISLLVGGIGVMNIMLVSVTERVREIGVRMATGARTLHILLQFNTEALVVCSVGGVLGVAAGLAVAGLARSLGHPVVFSLAPVLLAFGSAFATGLLFGYLPARKAARLDPVVALSAE